MVQVGVIRQIGLLGVMALLALAGSACALTQPNGTTPTLTVEAPKDVNVVQTERVPPEDDIFKIVQYWPQHPWLMRDERIVGFKVPTYFISGKTQRGAFVPGNVRVDLYRLDIYNDGTYDRTLVQGWTFDEATAAGFRVRKRTIQGYYYGFVLEWDRSLDLTGNFIEIAFGYERISDGRIVQAATRRLKVPRNSGLRLRTERPRLTDKELELWRAEQQQVEAERSESASEPPPADTPAGDAMPPGNLGPPLRGRD